MVCQLRVNEVPGVSALCPPADSSLNNNVFSPDALKNRNRTVKWPCLVTRDAQSLEKGGIKIKSTFVFHQPKGILSSCAGFLAPSAVSPTSAIRSAIPAPRMFFERHHLDNPTFR